MPNGAIHKMAHKITPELAVHHHLRQIATRVIVTKLGRAVVHATQFIATGGLIYHSL
jgi:hypothetical protein